MAQGAIQSTQRFQSRAPTSRVLVAQVFSSFGSPATVYTVPAASEAILTSFNLYYGGSDLGTETITISIVTKASVSVTFATFQLANLEWAEILTDAQELHIGPDWSIKVACTANIEANVVISGVELRLPQ